MSKYNLLKYLSYLKCDEKIKESTLISTEMKQTDEC